MGTGPSKGWGLLSSGFLRGLYFISKCKCSNTLYLMALGHNYHNDICMYLKEINIYVPLFGRTIKYLVRSRLSGSRFAFIGQLISVVKTKKYFVLGKIKAPIF